MTTRPAHHSTDVEDLRSLTTEQVSELTGIKRSTLDSWRSRGDGPPFRKVIGVVLYPLAGLRTWLEARDVA